MSYSELEAPPWSADEAECGVEQLHSPGGAAPEVVAAESDSGSEPLVDEHTPTEIVADSLAYGMAFLFGLNLIQRVVGLGRNILVCRMLSPEELGRWNLSFSFLLLAAPLAVLGLPGVFGRYVEHYRHRGSLRTFLRRMLTATMLSAAVAIGALSLAPESVSRLVFNDPNQAGLIRLALAVLVLVIASNYLTELMTALRQVRLVSIMHFCQSLVFAVAAVGLLYATTWGAEAVISAYAAGCLAVVVLAIPLLAKTWRGLPVAEQRAPLAGMWRKVAPFAVWIWATNILANLYNVADRYMLIHFASIEPEQAAGLVGQYHSALVVPQLMLAAAAMFSGVLLPYLADGWEAGDRRKVWDQLTLALKAVALAFTAGGAALLLAAPLLFGYVLGHKYGEGLAVLPITVVQCIWAGLHAVAVNYLWCRERPGLGSGALLAGLILNLMLNVALVPLFGLWGAITATAIANASAPGPPYYLSVRLSMPIPRGLLVASALPAGLLAGPVVAAVVVVATAAIVWRTDWLLTHDEKSVIAKTCLRRIAT